jgi:hypothetical protein
MKYWQGAPREGVNPSLPYNRNYDHSNILSDFSSSYSLYFYGQILYFKILI